MSKSKIQWTERTWNPMTGCTKLSEGCAHCYAYTMAKRLQGMGQYKYKDGFNVTLHWESLTEPFKILKPSMFFVCSMGDLFHKDVPYDFIDAVINVIRKTPKHTYQILTKRPQRMYQYFMVHSKLDIPSNLWIGTTVEEPNYGYRIGWLTAIKGAKVKFLSVEPMLGGLYGINLKGIDWVIVGGESGNQARPMKKSWVLNIKQACFDQGVAFFFKQWGTYGEDGVKRNKKANGCLIDGKIYQQFPR